MSADPCSVLSSFTAAKHTSLSVYLSKNFFRCSTVSTVSRILGHLHHLPGWHIDNLFYSTLRDALRADTLLLKALLKPVLGENLEDRNVSDLLEVRCTSTKCSINRSMGAARNCSLVLCKIWSLLEILGTSITPLCSQILSEIHYGKTILTTSKFSFIICQKDSSTMCSTVRCCTRSCEANLAILTVPSAD